MLYMKEMVPGLRTEAKEGVSRSCEGIGREFVREGDSEFSSMVG